MDKSQNEICNGIVRYFEEFVVGRQVQNGSFRSWEHCYNFFRGHPLIDRDVACLQLGFYLASWGMYRGSAAIRKYDYLIHRPVVDIILNSDIPDLYEITGFNDEVVKLAFAAHLQISDYYKDKVGKLETLVTKILLGTLACTPAYDKFLLNGLRKLGLPRTLSESSLKSIISYCQSNVGITEAQNRLNEKGFKYPIIRVFDIYCHSLGRPL